MPLLPSVPTVGVHAVTDAQVLLDVREPEEWLAGHAPRALHLPMGHVPDRLDEIPDDSRIVAVCRHGTRSARVTAYLRGYGFDVVNLAGGMLAWVQAGRPVVSEDGAPPRIA